MKHKIILFFSLFLIVILISLGIFIVIKSKRNPMASSAAESVQSLSVRELWEKFQQDQEKAVETFLNETILFHGVVTGTATSVYMTPNVMLSDREGGRVYGICVLPRADFPKLANFQEGEKVIMRGRVHRMNEESKGIVFKECRELSQSGEESES